MKMFAGLMVVLLVASSCDTLSRQECLQGNWYQVGLNDGINGHSKARIKEHNKACGRVGVAVDASVWDKGRRDGLKTYCTAESAYQVGRKGRQIGKVCTASQRTKMQPAFARGRQYFDITSRIDDLDQRVREAHAEIAAAIKANNATATADVFYLQGEIFDLEQRIRRLERERRKYSTWP